MSRDATQMRGIAERLVACEGKAGTRSEPPAPPAGAFHAIEKLRPHLATMTGKAGHRALLSRSLALAGTEIPWLRAVHVRSDASLEGLSGLHSQLASKDYSDGEVALLAELLGLLAALIGETLTLHLLRELWPEVSLGDRTSGKGGQK